MEETETERQTRETTKTGRPNPYERIKRYSHQAKMQENKRQTLTVYCASNCVGIIDSWFIITNFHAEWLILKVNQIPRFIIAITYEFPNDIREKRIEVLSAFFLPIRPDLVNKTMMEIEFRGLCGVKSKTHGAS